MSKSPEPELGGEPIAKTSPHVWVLSTYFAEGFPYTLVNAVAEVLFKELGAGLGAVGLTSLFHLPWNLKFLWAPWLDRFETKRAFLAVLQLLGAALIFGLALAARGAEWLGVLSVLFLLLAFVSATNDVAIDGYYMEALDESGQSRFVGHRVMAYRVSNLMVKGGLPVLAGLVGWSWGLGAMAAILGAVGFFHLVALPRVELRKQAVTLSGRWLLRPRTWLTALGILCVVGVGRVAVNSGAVHQLGQRLETAIPWLFRISLSGWIGIVLALSLLGLGFVARRWSKKLAESESAYAHGFMELVGRPQAGLLLAFVILFRTGETLLGKMKFPFLSDQFGFTVEQYGWANGTAGVIVSLAATLLGAQLIARQGLRRWFWPFLLAQNLLNLLYVALALLHPASNFWLLTAVIAIEEFGSGLGSAVLMILLMRACAPAHKATQFAVLTALMSLSFTFAGAASGFLAQALGYAGFFFLSFVATWPMMVLAYRSRLWESQAVPA